MVSMLESAFPMVEAPSRREGAPRESSGTKTPAATQDDPDLRLTLSTAAQRLAIPSAGPSASGDRPARANPDRVPETGSAPLVAESGMAERLAAPRAVAAYREAARPALGERISIRA